MTPQARSRENLTADVNHIAYLYGELVYAENTGKPADVAAFLRELADTAGTLRVNAQVVAGIGSRS